MRTLGRVRWLVPAIAVPLCIGLASLALQAAAFSRPSRNDLVAVRALATLLRYRVMRAAETIGGRTQQSLCLQGWFHAPGRGALQRGALVLIGGSDRLYDFGKGVRRVGEPGVVSERQRARFQLAGCPRFIAAKIGERLVHGREVDVDAGRADGFAVDAIRFGEETSPGDLFVRSDDYLPVELQVSDGSLHGRSDLQPGGGRAAVMRIRRAFPLFTRRRHA